MAGDDLEDVEGLLRAAADGDYAAGRALEEQLGVLDADLAAGDLAAVQVGLTVLEADPYFFRSGYLRNRIARCLARAPLQPADRARARRIVIQSVERGHPVGGPALAHLARGVADNGTRRSLRALLHADDPAVAHRALRCTTAVRHPGLTTEDIRRARDLVLEAAGRWPWLSPTVERLSIFLWNPEWAAELEALAGPHGPHRAAARRLLSARDLRRARRAGRAERPGP